MNETEKKYKQGDRVYFKQFILDSDGVSLKLDEKHSGWGKVCGVAGPAIIVEPENPDKEYPYTHLQILDVQIVDAPA